MTDPNTMELNDEELRQKINMETGRIDWAELRAHFDSGAVVAVDPQVDLVDIAIAFARDDTQVVEDCIRREHLWRALDADRERWEAANTNFWAVVVAPWVLVQELTH